MLNFTGSFNFKARIIYSVLSGKPVRFTQLKLEKHHEILLKLVAKISNGTDTTIQSNKVIFHPGALINGIDLRHNCYSDMSIAYFLEALLCLSPFGKNDLEITLNGSTSQQSGLTVDHLKSVADRLKIFGVSDIEIAIKKRDAVFVRILIVKSLTAATLIDFGLVAKVRGVAFGCNVPSNLVDRMSFKAKGLLQDYLPDIWITNECSTERGGAQGYGLYLEAQTTTQCALGAQKSFERSVEDVPEDVAETCTKLLLKEIADGGCFDSVSQQIIVLFMALCPEDVSSVRLGRLTKEAIQSLRDIRDFFGVVFNVVEEGRTILLACRGSGFSNLERRFD